jgi:Uma2 family endonuclease
MATRQLMRAEQLADMPEDGFRYELIEGELAQMAPAGFRHSRVAGRFAAYIGQHALAHKLGEVLTAEPGFFLEHEPDTVLAPDVAFVRRDRLPRAGEDEGFADLIPDLVVEVVSPSDRPADVARKIERYLRPGVPVVWLADPRRERVQVHRSGRPAETLHGDDVLDGGEVLPGFRVRVGDFFG